ncbi:hypothetical protein LTR91_003845 [Friedmanniomyces endolithicus]|uniref:Uncharacterized protein n=1 Tax=Friedmanniomyces endolithicus TaxID=329885 RepID=A0AAN6KW95_9PEZI|nr:hypothetical protein LTR35_007299 [Friedmanniomyces endolithicus]KAK0297387.1 hypothetical protein LTS00_004110 [Friedmanniomyces endolithicus]KAK0315473.1 hypothetical protein LTR01_000771 [Friedmanniomyces endolithicus]KAK0323034.1 hypothetical protein LTR82_005964 [Friedmanniomyces endolithicus]KAK0827033.1 hypothetical protein LTR73_005816 [Friedmanniomyces endolithicus]
MSSALHSLLCLPSSLRAQAFRQTLRSPCRPSQVDRSTKRAFTSTPRTLKQNNRPTKPTPTTSPPRRQPPEPSQKQAFQPPPPKSDFNASRSALPTYADTLLANHANPILLYKAPSHRSFYITSYFFGSLLLIGAYNWAIVVSEPPPGVNDQGSWGRYLMTGVTMGTTLVVSVFGTVLILAPVGMVGRISLLRNPAIGVMAEQGVRLPPVLRVEMETPLPFMKRKIHDLAPAKALLDRNVSAVDIELTSIPLKDAQAFTSDTAHLSAGVPKLQHPPRDAVSRFITTLTRDIRRMFYREGFAYMRSDKYGNWKVDLQHCELLDQGRPLDRLTVADPSSGKGPASWLKRFMVA